MKTSQTERVPDEELDQMIWKLERDGMTPKLLSLMRELREVRRAKGEPVAWMYDGEDGCEYNGHNEFSGGGKGVPLYAAPPAPVVPDEISAMIIAAIEKEQDRLFGEDYLMDSKDCVDVIREEMERLNACRVAMFNAEKLNQPVSETEREHPNSFTNVELEGMAHGDNPQANAYRELLAFRRNSQDGWIPVSERMPGRDIDVQVYCSDKKEQMVGYMERNEVEGWFRFASLPNGGGVYCKPTHWKPLPAAPKEVG